MTPDLSVAFAPGLAAPERPPKEEVLGAGRTAEDRKDCAIADRSRDATESARKAVANVQAKAALAGFSVEPIEADDGGQVFVVSRWNLTRQCNTLDDVRELLRRMGVAL